MTHALEFIGMIQPRQQSEIHPATGPGIDTAYLRESARAHDQGGFDRILIGWHSDGPDGLQIASYAAAHTEQVAEAFLEYHALGVSTFLIRGFDPLEDGRSLLPATRRLLEQRLNAIAAE
jgi:alkanesulfonate monooxygenase